MTRLKRLIHEIHRRSLWPVLGVFIAAAWWVLEFIEFVTERAGLPDWTPTMALVFLALGLPVVMATAFVQEGMPGTDKGVMPGGSGGPRGPLNPDPSTDRAEAGGNDAGSSAAVAVDTGPSPATPTEPEPTGIHGFLTWRNAILGGLGALSLVGAAVVVYLIMWSTGIGPVGSLVAQGVFEEGELVVLADFADATDTGMGTVVTEALWVDLQESNINQLAAPTYVSAGMARMGLPPDASLTAETALELALRDGLKAVIHGDVAPVGSGYLLTASVVATETGQVLRAFRVPVESDDELLAGIDRLSREIREKSGESLRSIRQGVGLAQATTGSLDALRLYTEAVRTFDEGRQLEALPLLEEAVELDPEFAMAWRKIAVILSNEGLDPERMHHASRRAYELRRRLTDREAGLAEAYYQSTVEDSPEAAIDAYRRLLERYPDDPTALNNVAVNLLELGRWDESEAPLRQVASSPAPSANSLGNFIQVLWNVGKREEAWSWQDSLATRYPRSVVFQWVQAALLAGDERWAEAHEAADVPWRDAPPGGSGQIWSLGQMAGTDLAQGRFAESVEHLGAARRNAVEARSWELYWRDAAPIEFHAAQALRGPDVARAALDRFIQEVPVDSLGQRSPGRAELAGYYALAGGSERARELHALWEDAFAPEERGRDFRFRSETFRALEAWGRQEWATSAAAFERMYRELQPCGANCIMNAEWGIALEASGQLDQALEKYRWHLADAQLTWHARLAMWTPVVLERMARIHAARGDATEARAADERIVEQFGDGDGPFVPFVERARERLRAASAGPD